MKTSVVAALVLVPLLGLAGCGSKDSSAGPSSSPTAATSGPTSPAATSSAPVVTPSKGVPPIPAFKGKPAGIISDTVVSNCSTKVGTVMANGTVKNTAPGPRDIAVAISWVSPGGSDVVARGVYRMHAAPVGKVLTWSVAAKLSFTGPVQCVTTALRGTFAGKAT